MSANACPDRRHYEQLVAGVYPAGDQLAHLAEHLERCPRCAAAVGALEGSDSLVSRAPGTPLPHAEDHLVRRLEDLLIRSGPPEAAEHDVRLAPPQEADEIGRLGPYRVLRLLGGGGMGVVFLAEDTQLRRRVALKVMRPALAGSDTQQQRFLREARAMAAVKHDHVATIYAVGQDAGVVFLAMELLEGETLEDRLRREGKLFVAEVLRLGRQTAEGLAAVHAHGLVHRDVKPGNLWLEAPHDRVKVLDFGLARGAGEAGLTRPGAVMGTPAYMAPEQARGGTVDQRSDLFSLGCVLYRACTGQVPFQGADTLSTLRALELDTPRPPHELNPEVPAALGDFILQMLAKDPARRPVSAAVVARVLARLEERLKAAQAPALSGTAVTEAVPAVQSSRRRRWRRWGLVAALALLVLPTLGYLGTRPGKQEGPPPEPPAPRITVANAGQLRELTVFDGDIRAIVWRPDGKQVAFVGWEKPVEVRDADSFRLLYHVGLGQRLVSFAFSPDPDVVAFCEKDRKTVRLLNLRNKSVKDLAPGGEQVSLAFSPDGQLMATGDDRNGARLWNGATGQAVRSLEAGAVQGRLTVVFSPKGKVLAVGNRNSTTRLFDVATGGLLHVLEQPMTQELRFSPDGKTLAAGYVLPPRVRLWDVGTGQQVREWGTEHEVFSLSWSPTGDVLATGSLGGGVTLWDPNRVSVLARLPEPGWVLSVRFSPDGTKLLGAGRPEQARGDYRAHVWGVR
jgi:hypothetical protein